MAGRVSVTHLIYGLALGGLEQLVVHLASRCQKRGIDASIVALGHDGPVRELARQQGVEVELLPANGLSLRALAGIRKALQKRSATVVHAHDLGPWLNAAATRVLRPSTRVIATFHEQRMPRGRQLGAAKTAAMVTAALVACGQKVRDDILVWAPSGARVPVIANGVPLHEAGAGQREKARAELGIPRGAVAIGYLGGLREIKGPDKLMEAFLDRFAGRKNVHLYMIGVGTMEAELRQMAQGHANIHLPGLKMNASRLLPGFDIYAQASLSEGRSLSMLEAMSAGLPTVAHDLLPVREIHQHGETALLAPLGDRAAFGGALERLIEDRALRERIGRNALVLARRHSIEPMVDAYEALYRELAA